MLLAGKFNFLLNQATSFPKRDCPTFSLCVFAPRKGEIEHGLFGEEAREHTRAALEKAAEYYADGYISQDFATMDFDMRNEDIFNGKCGVVFGDVFGDVWGAYWPLILHLDIDPEADWIAVPVVDASFGQSKVGRDAAQVQNILVATKDCEHPEALVKMASSSEKVNTAVTSGCAAYSRCIAS